MMHHNSRKPKRVLILHLLKKENERERGQESIPVPGKRPVIGFSRFSKGKVAKESGGKGRT